MTTSNIFKFVREVKDADGSLKLDIRRLSFPEHLDVNALYTKAGSVYEIEVNSIILKYKDLEGDLVTIVTETDLSDAQKEKPSETTVLRIFVVDQRPTFVADQLPSYQDNTSDRTSDLNSSTPQTDKVHARRKGAVVWAKWFSQRNLKCPNPHQHSFDHHWRNQHCNTVKAKIKNKQYLFDLQALLRKSMDTHVEHHSRAFSHGVNFNITVNCGEISNYHTFNMTSDIFHAVIKREQGLKSNTKSTGKGCGCKRNPYLRPLMLCIRSLLLRLPQDENSKGDAMMYNDVQDAEVIVFWQPNDNVASGNEGVTETFTLNADDYKSFLTRHAKNKNNKQTCDTSTAGHTKGHSSGGCLGGFQNARLSARENRLDVTIKSWKEAMKKGDMPDKKQAFVERHIDRLENRLMRLQMRKQQNCQREEQKENSNDASSNVQKKVTKSNELTSAPTCSTNAVYSAPTSYLIEDIDVEVSQEMIDKRTVSLKDTNEKPNKKEKELASTKDWQVVESPENSHLYDKMEESRDQASTKEKEKDPSQDKPRVIMRHAFTSVANEDNIIDLEDKKSLKALHTALFQGNATPSPWQSKVGGFISLIKALDVNRDGTLTRKEFLDGTPIFAPLIRTGKISN